MSNFNPTQRWIIKSLGHHKIPISISRVAKEINISWVTAKKYIYKFIDDGIVIREGSKYKINYPLIYGKSK